MASKNNNSYTFFTISQPFLGAPLQFHPALGSPEFEHLIDCYVTGSASKQDKLSQVTIDFYNNATVDLNTGALTKRYEVFNAPSWAGQSFEQSPVQSQSSGFSPPIFTPSPGSSATLGDSTYGSISLTPPTRNGAGRIAKKPKKDTKKNAEARLPGFSIMTKDGVDVTNSAGRGTKTKEQREHAHLMRQLKACADCKRKKVRCDPSHRRSHNDASRTSTSNSKTSSSGRINPSTDASTPSSLQAAQNSIPSFNTSNGFNDFVLFPEDTASWNSADIFLTDFDYQYLSDFNFDINEIDLNIFAPMTADQSFDFASPINQQTSSSVLPHQTNYAPFMSDQYGLDQWAELQGYSMSVNHTQPHPSGQYADSGQVNSTPDIFADIDWSRSATNHQPRSQNTITNNRLIHSSPSDWSILESSVNANISPQQCGDLGIGTASSKSLSDQSQSSRSRPTSPEFDSTGLNINPGFQDLPPDLSPGDSGILVRLAAVLIIAALIVSSIALGFISTTSSQKHKAPLMLLAFSAHGIESLRVACISWVGSNFLTSVGKLVLCATFAAKVPEILKQSNRSLTTKSAMTVLTRLSGSHFVGKALGDMANSLARKSGMKQRGISTWLGMPEHVSPVAAIL